MTESQTDLLAKSERKTISLDLDDKNSLPKQISITEPGPTLKKKKDTHSNKEKEKKPSTKEKKVKTSSDTSIIDSILKKNKVLPIVSSEKKAHVNDGVTSEPKKKMILDLNSGQQIITHNTKPVPEIKPALQFVPEKPKATIILKSEAKKQKQIHANSPESQFKLDTLFNIDSSINQTQSVASVITEPHTFYTGLQAQCNATAESQLLVHPKGARVMDSRSSIGGKGFCSLFTGEACEKGMYDKSAPHGTGVTHNSHPPGVGLEFSVSGNSLPSFSPPSYSDSTVQNTGKKQLLPDASVSTIDYAKELKEIDEQLAKVRAKLAKRGPDPKYLEMQSKLEARRAKYIRRQQRQEAGSSKPKPGVPEMVNKTSNIAPPIQSASNANSGLAQLFKTVKTPTKTPDLLDEVNFELNKAKDMLTNIEKNQDGSNSNAHQPILSSGPGKKVIKEQGTSIFAIPSELTSMREKKEHLLAEQRKIAERIGHRQKQIDKLKNWQREVEKMNELHAEKQKIFELQQDLKRLEKQQYEQDQKLKGQMYQVRKMAHSKSNELKRLDMIDTVSTGWKTQCNAISVTPFGVSDTFKSVKQRSQSVPVAQTSNLNQSVSTNTGIAPQPSSGFGGKLRAAINSLFAGERVMFTKNNTIPAPIKQIEPVGNIIITEDAKSGLEYKTAVTNIGTAESQLLVHSLLSVPEREVRVMDSRSSVGGEGFCSLFTGEACEKGMYDKSAPHGTGIIPETSSTLPVTKINDVIVMAKQIIPEVNNSNPISSETQISEHQINVYRDYFCDKVGISKKGVNNCFNLIANKDENHTAILVNAYKELCDEIRFS